MPVQAWKEILAPILTHEHSTRGGVGEFNQLTSAEQRRENDGGIDVVALAQQFQADHPTLEKRRLDTSFLAYGEAMEEHVQAVMMSNINRSTT